MSERNERKRRSRAKTPAVASSNVGLLQELFPEWSSDDLNTALADSDGNLEVTAQKIISGEIQRWGSVKTRKEMRDEKKQELEAPKDAHTEAPKSRKHEEPKDAPRPPRDAKPKDRKPKKASAATSGPAASGNTQPRLQAHQNQNQNQAQAQAHAQAHAQAQPQSQSQQQASSNTESGKLTWAQMVSQPKPFADRQSEPVAEFSHQPVGAPAASTQVEPPTLAEAPVEPIKAPGSAPGSAPGPAHGSAPAAAEKQNAQPIPLLPVAKAGEKLSWAAVVSRPRNPEPEVAAVAKRQELAQEPRVNGSAEAPQQPLEPRERKPRRPRKKRDDKTLAQQVDEMVLDHKEDHKEEGIPEQQPRVSHHAQQPQQAQPHSLHQHHHQPPAQPQAHHSHPAQSHTPGAEFSQPPIPPPGQYYDYQNAAFFQNQHYPYPQQRYQFGNEQYSEQFPQGQFEYDAYKQQHQQHQHQGQAQAQGAKEDQQQNPYPQHPYFVNPALAFYYQNLGYNGQYGHPVAPMPKNYQQGFYNQYRGSPQASHQQPVQQQQHQQPEFRDQLYNYEQFQSQPRQSWSHPN